MIENLIVMLIVLACAYYVGARYLPAGWRGRKAAPKAGCGSGCDTCNACATPVDQAPERRVIKIHSAKPNF